MSGETIGANLTAKNNLGFKKLLATHLEQNGKRGPGVSNSKFFTKAGAPVASTAADSPGSDNCWIYDTTNEAMYFVYSWSAANAFDVVALD
jgi:hypothetical protein